MASLTSAHLQRRYTLFIVVVLVLSAALVGGVLVFGQASATIVITPRSQEVKTENTYSIGSENTALTLKGTVTTSTVAASVTVKPSATGTPVDAHATGTMVIVNKSGKVQPLAAGTRFRATNGQIVRSQRRIDVGPGQEVSVGVVADTLGVSGNLEPGKFVIVALWAGLQDTIYGDLRVAMTGGTTLGGATLDLATLNRASDEAAQQLSSQHPSTDGTLVRLTPKNVSTTPKASVASASYTVTVTMTKTAITYSPADLKTLLQESLAPSIVKGFVLTSLSTPVVTMNDVVGTPSVTATLKGQIGLLAEHEALRVENLTGKSASEVQSQIAAIPNVAGVSVTISPRWRSTLPNDVSAIHLTIKP